jgi:integrase
VHPPAATACHETAALPADHRNLATAINAESTKGRATGNGNPLYRGTFWPSVWKPAVKKAGLEGLRVHDLRHTYVSLMIAAGANPKEVSTWAGHSSVSFTLDRYGHLYDEHGDDVADRLDALLSQARPSAEIRALK